MNTKHTPGPWFTDVADPAFVNYNIYASDTKICTMGIDMGVEEEAANARLIAAAPDMLEALEIALSDLEQAQNETDIDFRGSIEIARAAITKATNSRG
jgi:hypothetical protein